MQGAGGRVLNDVWYSTNGTTWTLATAHAPWAPRAYHTSVVYGGKMWVIGGTPQCDVWHSTNGTSWTQATASGPWRYGLSNHASVVFNGKMWVIAGIPYYNAWYSTNGTSWTVASGLPYYSATMYGMNAVVCDGRMWVMGGMIPPPWFVKSSEVLYTRDGKNWVQAVDHAPWLPRQNFGLVVLNRKMWVLGGLFMSSTNSAELNDVWYSEIPPPPTGTTPAWKLYR
jgi:hypothetical protein